MKHQLIKKSLIVGIAILFIGATVIPIISGIVLPNKGTNIVQLKDAKVVAESKLQQLQKNDFTIKNYKIITNKDSTLFYIFNLQPQGYIVVTARYDLTPVIAYSFTNNFGVIDSHTNPLLSLLETDIQYRINNVNSLPVEILKNTKHEWIILLENDFEGRLFQQWPPEGSTPTGGWVTTLWTQNAPYNNFCPFLNGQRSVAGCPAVVMAQILNYHQTTRNVQFTDVDDYYHAYSGNNFWIDNAYLTYQFPSWPQLNTYLNTLNDHWDQQIPLTNNDKAAVTVACGFAMHQVYNPGGSGTFGVDQADHAYQRFGFTDAELLQPENPELFTRLSSNMMNALPAHIAVVNLDWTVGHNMVVDGYNTDDFYHINFGWGGPYNGWYHIPSGLPYSLTVIEGVIVDILPEIHIRDLTHFPWYQSEVDSSAMTMKMILDYCQWNSSSHPQGPLSIYDEQTLWETYRGDNYEITGDEFTHGLNAEIDDVHATPPFSYGYFFAPYASISANDTLKQICIWMDYPIDYYNSIREVDVPKPGYANHMPVAVPLLGNYSRWAAIRGIFTDQNAWPIPTELTVFGFWLNDPVVGGLGNNTYVTVQQFLDNYYLPLNVPSDDYDGKYLAIQDPYQQADQKQIEDIQLQIGHTTASLSSIDLLLLRSVENSRTPMVLKEKADNLIVQAAIEQTRNVIENQQSITSLSDFTSIGKPVYINNGWTVQLTNTDTILTVLLDNDGNLLQFSSNNAE